MTALIWDLDGTLLDSYGLILDGTSRALAEAGVRVDRRELHRRLIAGSVRSVLREIGAERGLDPEALWRRVDSLDTARYGELELTDGAAETLKALWEAGHMNLIYTHNNRASLDVLRRHGVLHCFTDALTSEAGLPRKPAPDGIDRLVELHGLDRRDTFYIGDRPIDMECAGNAGVRGILFLPPASPAVPTGREEHIVGDLREIVKIISEYHFREV